MVDGPTIPKRITVGAPPSGLPDKKLSYPGKPLSHRYLPTEKTRIVVEDKESNQSKLASDTPFTPIVSVSYPDKNIRLGPVKNVRSRGLQPVVTNGSVTLPVNGNSVYEISEDLSGPLETRLQRLANQSQTKTLDDPEVSQNTGVQPTVNETSTSLDQASMTDLENMKKLAVEELAKRKTESSQDKNQETPADAKAQLPLEEDLQTPLKVADQQKKSPGLFPPPVPLETTSENTKTLLNRAQQLEDDLARLRQGITSTSRETEYIKETGNQLADVSSAKINQLVADRDTLTVKVTKLTQSHAKELNSRKELETKLDKLVVGYEAQLKDVMRERDKLASSKSEADANYQALENQVGNTTKEFDQKIQRIQIEKTNLIDQIKKLSDGQETIRLKDFQISDLQKKITQIEDAREESAKRYEKLEALVADLGKKTNTTPLRTAVDEPKPLTRAVQPQSPSKPPTREKESPKHQEEKTKNTARVVAPQQAIGRMAPSLTTAPNVINGILKDTQGLLLPNVIIVVKDDNDQPVRALKSNKIGQFAISTPLPNGTYIMELESPDHSFDIIQIEVNGKVLPPIEIKAIS